MKEVVPISFQDALLSKSVEFLQQESMQCLITQEAIPELISQLLYYKEEGKSLYPDIYIFDDIEFVRRIISYSQFCFIGKGAKSKETMLKALKKCAPLTENGWSIYIHRKQDEYDYGVFKGSNSLISPTVAETLVEQNIEGLNIILIHQIADKLIEVKGVRANSLIISYGNKASSKTSPLDIQFEFIKSITSKVSPELIEQTNNFFRRLFIEVLRKGHGTLSCVIKSEKPTPKRLSDGISLKEKIDIPRMIWELSQNDDLANNSQLEGQFSLILGMMQSDGITIFTDRGEIASYNVFIKHTKEITKTNTSGGARSRTFLTLSKFIGSGLEAAYIQSQDGKIECKNGK